MEKFMIKECDLEDIEKVKKISEITFYETFFNDNTEEDMEKYIKESFSYEQLESEMKDSSSKYFLIEHGEEIVAYMKINFDHSQTEQGHDNTLEIQRIYVLQKYKGQHIGKMLIQKAIEIARYHNLHYVWLGVWEKNTHAIRFYEKQGFKKFDTHIFKLGEDEQVDNLMKHIL